MATATKPTMRNVLAPVDPTAQQGSLAGTMAQPAPTANPTATPAATGTQAAAAPGTTNDGAPEDLSEEDWYQLLHNLGSAMKRANPEIESVLQQMSPNIDYAGQAAELRKKIEARQTTKPLPWYAAGAMGMTPQGQQMAMHQIEGARAEEGKKAADLEALQENLTMGHINDLQRRGKFQEALATMLLQKGITEAGARKRASEKQAQEKLRGENALNSVRERARTLSDTFHFDERMRLKMLDIAGKIGMAKLQKYGNLDPVMGGFTIKPEDYEKWQDETMAELYRQAASLQGGGSHTPTVQGTGVTATPSTGHGKTAKPKDPLGLR